MGPVTSFLYRASTGMLVNVINRRTSFGSKPRTLQSKEGGPEASQYVDALRTAKASCEHALLLASAYS